MTSQKTPRPTARPARAALLAIVALAALPTPGAALEVDAPEAPSTLVYPVDPDGLRREFAETGRVRLLLPLRGEVVAHGTETPFPGDRAWRWRDGAHPEGEIGGVVPDVLVEGRLVGEPGSLVRIDLGLYGVYGRVWSRGVAYDFDPRRDGDVHVQRVAARAWESPAPATAEPGDVRAAATSSTVAFDVEARYRARHGDWASRVTSAFQHLAPMWSDGGNGVGISLGLSGPWAVGDVTTQDDCSEASDDYHAFLGQYPLSGVQSYILWTSRNLVRPWEMIYACVWMADGIHHWHAGDRSGVAEGSDYWDDWYNADSAYERGIVAGHELGHIYGEENHATYCRGSYDCNIMKAGVHNSWRHFYWAESSRVEIRARYFENREA